jgi:hypothetical protein
MSARSCHERMTLRWLLKSLRQRACRRSRRVSPCAPQSTLPTSRAHCSESSLPETPPQPLSVPALSHQCLIGNHEERQQHLQHGHQGMSAAGQHGVLRGRSCTLLSASAWSLTHINFWTAVACYIFRAGDQQRTGHGRGSDAQAAFRHCKAFARLSCAIATASSFCNGRCRGSGCAGPAFERCIAKSASGFGVG